MSGSHSRESLSWAQSCSEQILQCPTYAACPMPSTLPLPRVSAKECTSWHLPIIKAPAWVFVEFSSKFSGAGPDHWQLPSTSQREDDQAHLLVTWVNQSFWEPVCSSLHWGIREGFSWVLLSVLRGGDPPLSEAFYSFKTSLLLHSQCLVSPCPCCT